MQASASQWRQAAELVRAGVGSESQSTLLVFAPAWIDPIGRQYLGDQMDIAMAARMDAARFESIWEVSMGGERAPETRGLKSESDEQIGPLHVRHYTQVPAKLVFDFTESFRAAKVEGAMHGRPNLSLEEVGFAPHRCIKVIPNPGASVSLRFDDVAIGDRIVGYVGLADVFTRRDVRDPGKLELLVDDQVLATVTAGVDDGWMRFAADTKSGTSDVEFRLTAVGPNARDRRICFAAEARR